MMKYKNVHIDVNISRILYSALAKELPLGTGFQIHRARSHKVPEGCIAIVIVEPKPKPWTAFWNWLKRLGYPKTPFL